MLSQCPTVKEKNRSAYAPPAGYNANAWNSGNSNTNFDQSLQGAINVINKIEGATLSDNQPLTALYDQNNTLAGGVGQVYVGGSDAVQIQWENNVNSGFQNFARSIGMCQ